MGTEHIFFDLDRTLWDFERNSYETLDELFHEHKLDQLTGVSSNEFIVMYKDINEKCWEDYRQGKIKKEELRLSRFRKALQEYEVNDQQFADNLGELYIVRCPLKTHLFDGTIELLDELSENYHLHIITNGFEEVQHIKLKSSGLTDYFRVIMTSEKAGCKKPDTDIFLKALKDSNAKASHSLMVGDHYEVDVIGAENVGMVGVLFDPENVHINKHKYRINEIGELRKWV